MLRALDGGTQRRSSTKGEIIGPYFGQLLTFCVHNPGHNTMRRRLLQTDLVRVQGGPKGQGSVTDASGLGSDV
jgi:hypothetical protein